MYNRYLGANFKHVMVDLGNGSDWDGEWMYMLEDGTPIPSWALFVEDEADEKAAKSFGWSEEEINNIRAI